MFVFTWDSRLGSSTRDLERSRLAFSSLSLTTFYIIGRSLHLHLMLRPFSCHWVFFQNHLSYLFLSENKPWATRLAPHGRSFGDPRAPPCQQFIAIIGSFLCFLCFFCKLGPFYAILNAYHLYFSSSSSKDLHTMSKLNM